MNYKNRVTPENITELNDNEIFIFGSNLAGRHGAGAAKMAMKFGAKYGQASGLQGNTYAIPTKDENIIRTLTIKEIKPYVDEFIEFAKQNEDKIFLVTKIGTGLATNTIKSMASLFIEAKDVENIYLPIEFWNYVIN
jgi:hypothetical protein